MKPQKVLRLMLILPYLAWVLGFLFIFLEKSSTTIVISNPIINTLKLLVEFYVIFIIYWGIPYTILAAGLLLWSNYDSLTTMHKTLSWSPFGLAALMIVEFSLINPTGMPNQSIWDFLMGIFFNLWIVGVPTLLFGYFFVGLGTIIYRILEYFDMVKIQRDYTL